MVTYEDARQYRIEHQLPLTWDEEVPVPPYDRIEFTRLILQTAEEAGLTIFAPRPHDPYEPEASLKVFQEKIHRFTYRQRFHRKPEVSWSGTYMGVMCDGDRALRWDEYVEQLEEDYYKPWKTSWLFGVSTESEARILPLMRQRIGQYREEFSSGGTYSDALKYPNADAISGDEIIAAYLDISDARDLGMVSGWEMGSKVPLEEDRWLGLRGDWIVFVQMGLWIAVFLTTIWLLVTKLYSGWWLLLIIPILAVLTTIGFFSTVTKNYRCWVKKERTFNSYAAEIVVIKKREWAELQRAYAII